MNEDERKPNDIVKRIEILIFRMALAEGEEIEHIQYQLRELHKQLEDEK